MTPVFSLLAGLLIGGVGVWFLTRREVQYLRDELTTATDRLLAAWKEGAIIPTREAVEPTKAVPKEPIPLEFVQLAADFESPEGQSDAEEFIRQKLRQGWGYDRIKGALDGSGAL